MIADILMRGILKCEQEDFTSRMDLRLVILWKVYWNGNWLESWNWILHMKKIGNLNDFVLDKNFIVKKIFLNLNLLSVSNWVFKMWFPETVKFEFLKTVKIWISKNPFKILNFLKPLKFEFEKSVMIQFYKIL